MPKKIKPVWNIVYRDISNKCVGKENIFDYFEFKDDCDVAYKKNKDDFDKFADEVKRSLFYYFCSKCEWEIILSDFSDAFGFEDKKVDVYDQVMLNWDVFIHYIWNCYKGVKL